MTSIWDDMKAILKAPVAGELDLSHLFLLVGLVLIMIIGWIIILGYIRAAAAEVV